MQYSVFICDLDGMEVFWLKEELGSVIHHGEDSVALVSLGRPEARGSQCFDFMGAPRELPSMGPVIV